MLLLLLPVAPAAGADKIIDRADAVEDVELLRRLLREEFAYVSLRDVDFEADLTAIAAALPPRVPEADLAERLQRLLARFGDGHSGVRRFDSRYLEDGCAPYLLAAAGGRLVAFREDRTAFLSSGHPCVRSIDGAPVEAWLNAAKPLVAQGSPQFVRQRSIRLLRRVRALRSRMGLAAPDGDTTTIELESEDGRQSVELLFEIGRKPMFGAWPRSPSATLEGNIGYLRIPSMDSDLLEGVRASMKAFAGTRALIIDVRGNTGGGRHLLLELLPRFLPPGSARVVNAARLRAARAIPPDALTDRFMYPRDHAHWSPREQAAIDAFAETFVPGWATSDDMFGPWHFLVIDRDEQRPAYDGPVVVLMDSDCFSATDIFLGAFKGLPGVTLIGTPSGGGSGRYRKIRLPRSGITVQLSSMASFQPNGRTYDGHGIDPDILVRPVATDFIGRTDIVLDAARAFLADP